ncbi:ABC transporter permease [Desulfovibrio inopinatus]|uniref:ABC transporter permease n=1 Tax=Desulfovibrio inopinatus TaxID=102109 RepID=UPI0004119010|nr:ABC transporter permease [Desulfovibrio inopinatus]
MMQGVPHDPAQSRGGVWLVIPAFVALVVLFVVPLVRVLLLSCFDPGFTLEHFVHFFRQTVYSRILYNTVRMSCIATLASLCLGYAIAYVMSRSRPVVRLVLLAIVVLSFGISLLLRVFSWSFILQRHGPVNWLLMWTGATQTPLPLLHNEFSVLVGLTHIFTPYAVFPIYSMLVRTDPNLERAARNLGASRMQAFWRVTFPLSLPGVEAAGVLIFIMALGSFVTPALLGGRKEQMLSNVIQTQVTELLNWPFAAAMSLVLLAVTLLCVWVASRSLGVDRLMGHDPS